MTTEDNGNEEDIGNLISSWKEHDDDYNIEISINILLCHYDWFKFIQDHLVSNSMGPIKIIGMNMNITLYPTTVIFRTGTTVDNMSINNRDELRNALNSKILTTQHIIDYKKAMRRCGVNNPKNMENTIHKFDV